MRPNALHFCLLAAMFGPSRAGAQDSTFAFRDVPLGSPESVMHEHYDWGCQDLAQKPSGLDIVLAERSCSPLWDPKDPERYRNNVDFGTFAGAPLTSFILYYWDKQFSGARLRIGSASFEDVVRALTTRYGPPSAVLRDTVRNQLGASFENLTLRWERRLASITVRRFGGSLTESEVVYALRTWEKATLERRKQREKARADDL